MSSAGQPTVRLSPPQQQWQYYLLTASVGRMFGPDVDVQHLGQTLNAAGYDGWEVVSIVAINGADGGTTQLLVTLKRPRLT